MALGGLIVGCTIIYVVTNTGRVWFRHVRSSSLTSTEIDLILYLRHSCLLARAHGVGSYPSDILSCPFAIRQYF